MDTERESIVDQLSFDIGRHRPVYFWAGPTTVWMNRLKFMDAPVNEAVHLEGHGPDAARLLVQAGFNWAYLMYNWGFPPEQDSEQHETFRDAVRIFHEAGLRVFGYVQLSNCVYAGSYLEKDWYAQDQRGQPIYYYTGRYMTCWLNPEWREQLRQRVRGVVEAGADGVFLDNPWMGQHTISLLDTWVSGSGCYCPRCREAYAQSSGGLSIPDTLDAHDPPSQQYLSWRVDVVWQLIGELADYARSLRPGVVVAENVYDAINRNHYTDFGVDLRRAAEVSDVVMIENHSLPRLAPDATPVVNSITCKAARAWSGDTPVTTDPYIGGIGFDPVYSPRQFRRAVAEGAACGTATVVKGTEFFDQRDGGFTLLTGEPFGAERRALSAIHRWLEAHADLYKGRQEVSPIAVYFPYDTLPFEWGYVAPLTFAACQTLMAAGLPYRIVGPGGWDGVQTLIVPPSQGAGLEERLNDLRRQGGSVIALGESRSGAELVWARDRPGLTFLQRNPVLRALVGRVIYSLYRAYFERPSFRRALDSSHVTQRLLQGGPGYNPLFRIPPEVERAELLSAIGEIALPYVRSDMPVCFEWWRQGDFDQLHLVNYAGAPQVVSVSLPSGGRHQVLLPDTDEKYYIEGRTVDLSFDVYAILLCGV